MPAHLRTACFCGCLQQAFGCSAINHLQSAAVLGLRCINQLVPACGCSSCVCLWRTGFTGSTAWTTLRAGIPRQCLRPQMF